MSRNSSITPKPISSIITPYIPIIPVNRPLKHNHTHCCASFPNPLDSARLLPPVATDGIDGAYPYLSNPISYPTLVCGIDDALDLDPSVAVVAVGNLAKQTVLPSASVCDEPNCDRRIGNEYESVCDPDPLSLSVEWRVASYSCLNMGRRVGRQAQIMPTDCSIEDHVAVSIVLYMGSLASEKSKAIMRRTETIQTLGLSDWAGIGWGGGLTIHRGGIFPLVLAFGGDMSLHARSSGTVGTEPTHPGAC